MRTASLPIEDACENSILFGNYIVLTCTEDNVGSIQNPLEILALGNLIGVNKIDLITP